MKKSPLSTPGNANNFSRGRGQRRGYAYRQTKNDNDNYHRFTGHNHSMNNPFDGDMIPLDTSSPKFNHNRGPRQNNDMRNPRFSNTGISGSYNQRDNFQNSPPGRGSPYAHPRFQRNQQHNNRWKNNNQAQNRDLPISEFFDIQSACENPWAELERHLEMENSNCNTKMMNDSSVEIISEQIDNVDSSPNSSVGESTINISSSCDENKQSSSVDLTLESMNFSQNSSDVILLSDNLTSQSDNSLNESGN